MTAGSLVNIQGIEPPAARNSAAPRQQRGVSFDEESPDERLAAPLLVDQSWAGSDGIIPRSSGILPPTVSTVTSAATGLSSGLVRAIAVTMSIAIVAAVVGFVGVLVTNEIESLISHLYVYKSEAEKLQDEANDLLDTFQLNITQAESYVQKCLTNMSFRKRT